MADNITDRLREQLKRYIDAGTNLSKFSRAELEEMLRDLMRRDTSTRERLEEALEDIRTRSRRGIDLVMDALRHEVRREMEAAAARRRDEFVDVVDRAFSMFGDFFKGDATDDAPAAKKSAAKKSPGKKAAGKKAAAKKAPAKKTAAKKTGAKKAPAKKAARKSAS